MLAIIISWFLISLVFLSFGDFFIYIYNRFSRQNEQYSVTDTFMLGMCFTLIPLSIASLWLASNQYTLLAYIVLSITYWVCRRRHAKEHIQKLRARVQSLSLLQLVLIAVPIVSLAIYALWNAAIFDAAFYHYQYTHWAEEYGVVPGLANLESRMGFNSNYLLLSAIFSLRFWLGEPVYLIQSLFAAYIVGWIMLQIIRSNYELKSIILLFIFCLFYSFNIHLLNDSSTDIIPALCAFYIASKYILNPNLIKQHYLLVIFIPVSLTTFKLSAMPFALLSVYMLYVMVKQKDFKALTFITVACTAVVVPWLVRNVIITGYLIYPLHEIDLFAFDWKLPKYVAELDRMGISVYAHYMFRDTIGFGFFFRVGGIMQHKMWFVNDVLTVLLYLISLFSPLVVAYIYLAKKKIHPVLYVIYLVLAIYIIYWAISAPDFRFITGVMYAMLLVVITFLLAIFTPTEMYRPKLGKYALVAFAAMMLLTSAKRTHNYYYILKLFDTEYSAHRPLSSILIAPFSSQAQAKSQGIETTFTTYPMGKHTIYISNDELGRCYDQMPAAADTKTKAPKHAPIESVEARGENLQDGFRPKK